MNGSGQELAPGPEVVAQVPRHGRRASSKVPMERDLRHPQGKMWAQPVVFKAVYGEQAVPRRGGLGERRCLAREGMQPIPHASVEPFAVVRSGMVDQLPQSGPHLNREEMAVRVTMLDRLRHLEGVRHDEWWSPPSAGPLRLAILLGQHLGIASPAIGTPGDGALSCPCGRLGDGPRDELVANAPGGIRHDKTTGTVEHEAPPAFAAAGATVRLIVQRAPGAGGHGDVFLRTKDQNASISTVERCRSWTSTALSASACCPAKRTHRPIVSYLCP